MPGDQCPPYEIAKDYPYVPLDELVRPVPDSLRMTPSTAMPSTEGTTQTSLITQSTTPTPSPSPSPTPTTTERTTTTMRTTTTAIIPTVQPPLVTVILPSSTQNPNNPIISVTLDLSLGKK